MRILVQLLILLFLPLSVKAQKFYTLIDEMYLDPELSIGGLLLFKEKEFEVVTNKLLTMREVERGRYFLVYRPFSKIPFKLRTARREVLPEMNAKVINPYMVKVRANPRIFKAGSRKYISIYVNVKDMNGEPVEGLRIEFVSSEGEVKHCREEGRGKYVCKFYPSSERYPRITVIEARVNDGKGKGKGWITLIQKGRASLEGETEPNSKIEFIIGEKKVAETTADMTGNFSASIEVEPGYTSVKARLTDPSGNVSVKRIRFNLPPPPRRIYYFLYPPSLPADGVSQTKIFIYAVDRFGSVLKSLRVKAKKGKIKYYADEQTAIYTAPLIRGIGVERERIEIITEEGVKKIISLQLVRFNLPGRMEVEVDREEIPADGTGELKVKVRIYDVMGKELALPLSIRVKNGYIKGKVKKEKTGYYTLVVKGPPSLIDKYLEIIVFVKDFKIPFGKKVRVKLIPGVPWKAEVISAPSIMVANGKEREVIKFEVKDRGNNPIPSLKLKIKCVYGTLGRLKEIGEGKYEFVYTSPMLRRERTERINVTSQNGRNLGVVKIFLSPKPFFLVVSPHIGFYSNVGNINSFVPGLKILFRLPLFDKRLFTFVEWNYHWMHHSYNGSDVNIGEYKIKTALEAHSILAGFQYSFYLTDALSLPFGIGGGIVYERVRIAPSFQESYSVKGISWIAGTYSGLEYKIGIGKIYFEIGYSYSPPQSPAGEFLKLEGNVAGIFIFTGFRFEVL